MNPEEITAGLRDIKPPIEIPEPSGLVTSAILGLIILGIAMLATFYWWLHQRRTKVHVDDPVADAIHELETARALLEGSSSEAYAVAVSNVLRRYLERHLAISAVRQTTEEFLTFLANAKHGPAQPHRGSLREFLRICDFVKFAKGTLGTEQRQKLHGAARAFIETTSNLQDSIDTETSPLTRPQIPSAT